MKGCIKKMTALHKDVVEYQLPIGDEAIELNPFIGKTITLKHTGSIQCLSCQRNTNKSFGQGYCFPCFRSKAACDLCIMKPENCHYHLGTCREPSWADEHCMRPHVVYLANSSGLKVGLTRDTQVPTRWIDQGAIQALPIITVEKRYHAGLIEDCLKQHVSDKTNWRAMLKGAVENLDLIEARDTLLGAHGDALQKLQDHDGPVSFTTVTDAETLTFHYPVEQYPEKVSSQNFDKTPVIEGTLMGIKGQYLILDTGVLNIRKFTSYEIEFQS